MAPTYVGASEIINIFSGSTQVLRAYLGSGLVWEGEVIESIQRGFSDIGTLNGNATATVTITSVDTAKSIVVYTITSGSLLDNVAKVDAVLSDATTITVKNRAVNADASSIGFEYQVVEFK